MKRDLISFELASAILEPYKQSLVKAIIDGFSDYMKISSCTTDIAGFVEFEVRTKACLIHDLIRKRVKETYSDELGVSIGEWNRIFGIKIGDDLFLRFKKLDKNYRSSNYPTEQARSYLGQHIFSGFPDGPTLLFVGYMPNETWTDIKGIFITCWEGDNLLWLNELLSNTTSYHPKLINDDQATPTSSRVSVKRKDSKKSTLSVVQ